MNAISQLIFLQFSVLIVIGIYFFEITVLNRSHRNALYKKNLASNN